VRGRPRLRRSVIPVSCAVRDLSSIGSDERIEDALRWLGIEREEMDAMLRPTAEVALLHGPAALSPAELDFRLREIERSRHAIDATIGRLLLLLLDRRLDRDLGFDSFEHYVRERVGFSLRKARALIALGRGVARDTALGGAYGAGKISWVQALVLLPLIRRGAPARPWIFRAGEITLRQLSAEADAAIELAVLAGGPVGSPPSSGTPQPEGEGVQMCETPPGREVIDFRAPASVAALWSAAIDAWRSEREASWQALARMLEAVTVEWAAVERHRDPVFARDGWRCAVPGCSARRDLHDHHVVFRSQGGGNELSNRISVCQPHHTQGIHAGKMRATGRAPGAIVWELGLLAGGRPLARLAGDVYLDGAPWGR
jgi:hypothetical protein